MFLTRISRSIAALITEFANKKQTPTTLQQFVAFGIQPCVNCSVDAVGKNPTMEKALLSAKFLHEELPVRLAHMTREIDALPPALLQTPSVQKVRSWYGLLC